MKNIALISCGKRKFNKKTKATNLYVGDLFRKSIAYARKINVDKIYILSAKYGLLCENDEIEPYDVTLKTMKKAERKKWSDCVVNDLSRQEYLENTNFIILASIPYREFIVEKLPNYEIPMSGLSQGNQLKFLKENLQ